MLDQENAVLLVVDIQGKLAHLMHEHELVYRNISRLIKTCEILHIPILWTEQAPDKIGTTIPLIQDLLFPMVKPIAKRSFSCWGSAEFVQSLQQTKRRQVILTGIETHVCIYQTAADLQTHGFEVHLAADATSARSHASKEITLARIRHQNVTVTCAESSICELLKTADHPKFKEVMSYIK
jgi:isochorismate hydrolase